MGDDITMLRLARLKVLYDVHAFGRCFGVFIGEGIAVGYREVGPGHLKNDDTDLRVPCRNLNRCEIPGCDVVVVPEALCNHLMSWEQLPYLRGKDAKVGASVGGGLRTGVARQNVQHS